MTLLVMNRSIPFFIHIQTFYSSQNNEISVWNIYFFYEDSTLRNIRLKTYIHLKDGVGKIRTTL